MARRRLDRSSIQGQRCWWVTLLLDSADEVALPTDPELRAGFTCYIKRGNRMALIYSRDTPSPVDVAEVSRWSWARYPPRRPFFMYRKYSRLQLRCRRKI